MNKLIIIGYSGHSYVVIEAAMKAGLKITGYADKKRTERNPYELEYVGDENDSAFPEWDKGNHFLLGIGNNSIRAQITRRLQERREKLISVIHPDSTVSGSANIGNGSFISSGAQINALSRTGTSVIINTGAIVEHECTIHDFSHIAPGAVLAGNVTVGVRSFIGANAVVKEGVNIGDDVVIGAGSVVINNVENGSRIVGNPGKKI